MIEVIMIKKGDKLFFNYGCMIPTKTGTVRSIVPSKYSKGGAFAEVEIISRETDDIGNGIYASEYNFAEITSVDVGSIMKPGETSVNGSPIGVFLDV